MGVEVGDGACCSRYALPEALGTMPVLRKILRGVDGFRVRGEDVFRGPENMGAEVPPRGGLKRRLSAMLTNVPAGRKCGNGSRCWTGDSWS